MPTIATLTVNADGSLEGTLATLNVTAPISIVANGRKSKDSEPHAGAKCLARAGDDDRADAIILARPGKSADQLVGHFERKGVHLFGTIERHGHHPVFDRAVNRRIGHCMFLGYPSALPIHVVKPPSTGNSAPVIYLASSDARNSAA